MKQTKNGITIDLEIVTYEDNTVDLRLNVTHEPDVLEDAIVWVTFAGVPSELGRIGLGTTPQEKWEWDARLDHEKDEPSDKIALTEPHTIFSKARQPQYFMIPKFLSPKELDVVIEVQGKGKKESHVFKLISTADGGWKLN